MATHVQIEICRSMEVNSHQRTATVRRGKLARFSCKALLMVILPLSVMNAAYANCFVSAGRQFSIDPLLLKAIAQIESSMNPGALHKNKNGSEDIGMMQINSVHLDRLEKNGITRSMLLADPCISVVVGAEILSGFIEQYGYTWRAVGAYNAGGGEGRDPLRERYAMKVVEKYRHLKSRSKFRTENSTTITSTSPFK